MEPSRGSSGGGARGGGHRRRLYCMRKQYDVLCRIRVRGRLASPARLLATMRPASLQALLACSQGLLAASQHFHLRRCLSSSWMTAHAQRGQTLSSSWMTA